MTYYGLTATHILTIIAVALFVLYLVLFFVARYMERNRTASEVHILLDSLKRCSSGDTTQCEKCEYRHRGTKNQTCGDILLKDSEKTIKDQQKLIGKFAKMME